MNAVTSPVDLDSVLRGLIDTGLDPEVALTLQSIAAASIELAGRLRCEPLSSDGAVEQPLDIIAHNLCLTALRSAPVRAVLSAAAHQPIVVDHAASLAVALSALEGAGNRSTNAPMGTIFSVLRPPSPGDPSIAFLASGRRQIRAAGFVMYGPATVMALSVGRGTDLYVLGRDGAMVRTHTSVAMPSATREFAINAANCRHWDPRLRIYIDDLVAGADGPRGQDFNTRWIAAVVAETYRILLRGGIVLYPSDARDGYRTGRLRLLYEAQPIAFLVEQAGGAATDMTNPMLDRVPRELHERCPLVFGSCDEVGRVAEYLVAPQFTGERSPLFATRGLLRS
jgi:fructose-1,6-bisphosphatase I